MEMNINQIIEQHALWLATNEKEGSCADLTRADLTGANLGCANLTRADLTRAYLTRAYLEGANLACANLTDANLTGANLAGANLAGANLAGANLAGAYLTGANLTGADLEGAIGNLAHLKSIFCEDYPVAYTAEVMQVGCQRHKIDDWWSFNDDRIIAMDGKKALEWWRIWKPILQQIIAESPATATGYAARDAVN